jgi:DNA-binding PadR family transcriptional regulator
MRILIEFSNGELHGYELARKIGLPVTGIYYHLKELADEGLIVSEESGRRKVYSLTVKGKSLVSILTNTTG